jgi:hypothetical protein
MKPKNGFVKVTIHTKELARIAEILENYREGDDNDIEPDDFKVLQTLAYYFRYMIEAYS